MKNIAELINTEMIKPKQVNETPLGADGLANVFNLFYEQLIIVFPASSAVLKDENSKKAFKQQWLQAFKENGITKLEYLRAGLKVARAQNTDFLPSTGKFIAWCKQGISEQIGLPTPEELIRMLMDFSAQRGIIEAEDYPFPNDACYWLVTDLMPESRERNLSKKDLLEHARIALLDMTKKILDGYEVPKPVKRISSAPVGITLTREQSLNRIQEIKRKFMIGQNDAKTVS
ncbi:Replication protein P [Gilliamella sp. Pra-s65]|uniref:replication protein P n=1 Tax=unclassified Gilliamella TaxID=2685620 RepID=UPI001365787F|nr:MULTISPECIES: replication protein P [unclassified Gilliamella]MWN91305.1 Replication protein P [Gilliamella sp. Pra-s65]MWP74281.1 Replication protein P [Gilliamella sp. Pra-s52]